MTRKLPAIATVLMLVLPAHPCTWAPGFFYQVTGLRGNVVGARLGPLQYSRWLRQSFERGGARLKLYEYRWPIRSREEMPLVKTVTADQNGKFDFGPLKKGHYRLIAEIPEWNSA